MAVQNVFDWAGLEISRCEKRSAPVSLYGPANVKTPTRRQLPTRGPAPRRIVRHAVSEGLECPVLKREEGCRLPGGGPSGV